MKIEWVTSRSTLTFFLGIVVGGAVTALVMISGCQRAPKPLLAEVWEIRIHDYTSKSQGGEYVQQILLYDDFTCEFHTRKVSGGFGGRPNVDGSGKWHYGDRGEPILEGSGRTAGPLVETNLPGSRPSVVVGPQIFYSPPHRVLRWYDVAYPPTTLPASPAGPASR